jgi:hypothetical protein
MNLQFLDSGARLPLQLLRVSFEQLGWATPADVSLILVFTFAAAHRQSNAFVPHPRPSEDASGPRDTYQDVLRTVVSCLRTELLAKRDELFVVPKV